MLLAKSNQNEYEPGVPSAHSTDKCYSINIDKPALLLPKLPEGPPRYLKQDTNGQYCSNSDNRPNIPIRSRNLGQLRVAKKYNIRL